MEKNSKRAANDSRLRTLAEKMYIEECLTAKAIAESLAVSPQTIGRWKKGLEGEEDWDTKRERYKREPYNIRKLINDEVARLANGEEPTLDMKAINAAIKAQQAVNKSVSPETVFTVFREFDNWMAGQNPEVAVQFTEWHRQFLMHKMQEA